MRRAAPTGRTAFSIGARKLPSNIPGEVIPIPRFCPERETPVRPSVVPPWQDERVTASTPADLAIAFRSLPRRRTEALEEADGASTAAIEQELDRQIAAAAALMHAPADAAAVGDAIHNRPSDEWDAVTLRSLRQLALDAGAALRRIADAG